MNTEKINKLFGSKLTVFNLGIDLFIRGIEESGGRAVKSDWQPPAGGDEKLLKILSKLKK